MLTLHRGSILVVSIALGGSIAQAQTFVNQGLVGFYNLSAVTLDSFGDTVGGIGSAIAVQPASWYRKADGTYAGRLVVQPDRGHNTQGTVDYPARQLYYDFTLKPYYGNTAGGAIGSMTASYVGGVRYQDKNAPGGLTTGLDPTGFRPASAGFPDLPTANGKICIDAEGLAIMQDGSYWMSDEYGPYIYHLSSAGVIISAIQPPRAFVPLDAQGNYYFTSSADPATGRVANQGFEALTVSPDNKFLYATMQSALVQDGGSTAKKGPYTRLLQYDISSPASPKLVGEYVVQLPVSNKGAARSQSEMYYIDGTNFLLLPRDGSGNGNGSPPAPSADDLTSKIKNIATFSIAGATNIANTQYDTPQVPVAPNGVLVASIVPAQVKNFISLIDNAQLSKATLQNGPPQISDIVGKYESIAVVSVLDAAAPDDYFVISLADNDFITATGVQDGVPYADPYAVGTGIDVPIQWQVYRVTIPGLKYASYINRPVQPSGVPKGRRAARKIVW